MSWGNMQLVGHKITDFIEEELIFTMTDRTCEMCGRKMTIDEDWLDIEFRGYVWFCECGNEEKAFRHVHTRNCYDFGHGSANLICGKNEGDFE